jgi:hypothetical protein
VEVADLRDLDLAKLGRIGDDDAPPGPEEHRALDLRLGQVDVRPPSGAA